MIPLIDGDLVCYRSAASCEPTKAKALQEPLEFALGRLDDVMHRILDTWGATEFRAFISGPDNFRYHIDPNYKANRRDKPRPEWLEPCRERLVTHWGAVVSDGIEADDNLGIAQTEHTIICSLDKDLLQVPGQHWNWVREEHKIVDEHTGWVNFYTQLIMGDRSDNVTGYDLKMRQIVPQFLQPHIDQLNAATSEQEMINLTLELYGDDLERYNSNAQLLYIMRNEGEFWPDYLLKNGLKVKS